MSQHSQFPNPHLPGGLCNPTPESIGLPADKKPEASDFEHPGYRELRRLLEVGDENVRLKEEIKSLQQQHSFLIESLHRGECHPDFEYARSHGLAPNALTQQTGWELNTAIPESQSVNDLKYWRRLKSARLADPAFVQNLPPVVMAPMTREEVLDAVREVTNKGYMPSSKKEGFNSKPEYVTDLNAQGATNYYAYEGEDFYGRIPNKWEFPVPREFDCCDEGNNRTIYAMLVVGNVTIWINLKNDVTYLRAANEAGKWGPWTPWGNPDTAYPIDRILFAEQINLL